MYKNANIVFNFHQNLRKPWCAYVIFTVAKGMNPAECRNMLQGSVCSLQTAFPPCSGTGLRGRGELCCPVIIFWGNTVSVKQLCTSCMCFFATHILCAYTRATRVALWAGCVCSPGSFLLPDYFPHFLGWKISVKTSLNIPAGHKLPGKWNCLFSASFTVRHSGSDYIWL